MYSCGLPHMAVQKQDDQHEHTFSNYVRIRDVVQKTCLRRWMIGKSGERGSGISVLPVRHDDDDDDDDIYIYIYIYIYICCSWLWSSSFMHSSDRLKCFQIRPINMVKFSWGRGRRILFMCICALVCVHLNVSVSEYIPLFVHT